MNIKDKIKKIDATIILAFVLISISLLYNFQEIISLPPYSLHQWRQADALSITLNYFKEGMDFLNPKMHFQRSIEGRGVGEFPIIYYFNAAVWHITGQSNTTARLLNIIIAFMGFIALQKASFILLKDKFYSIIIPVFVFTSSLYSFYLSSFLVNVDAISFVFISWYFIVKYWKSKKLIHLIAFSVAITFAGLLRPTVLLGLAPFYLIFFLELIGVLKGKLFKNKTMSFVFLLAPVAVVAVWLIYAMSYNSTYNSVYFLTKLRPIWAESNAEITRIFKAFYSGLLPWVFHYGIEIILGILLVFSLIFVNKQNKYLAIFWITIFIEIIVYLLLWFLNLDVHDYYLLEILMLIPPLLLSVFYGLKKNKIELFNSVILKSVVLIIVLFSIAYNSIVIRANYKITERTATEFFLSKSDVEYWDWYHWQYDKKFRAYETITPYLREIGLKRDDIVISLIDYSPNISLYFMDQKGFTSLYQVHKTVGEQIKGFKDQGAKYLIINDTNMYNNNEFSEYRKNRIGSYKNIEIYKL